MSATTPEKLPIELKNAISTREVVASVPAAITAMAEVEPTILQLLAKVKEVGEAATLAVHAKPGMKLAPDTVMVLPT